MTRSGGCTLVAALAGMLAVAPAGDGHAEEGGAHEVQLAAGWIDMVLRNVAASAEAVGREFGARLNAQPPESVEGAASWQTRAEADGDTEGFRTWPDGDPEPAFQAEVPSLYSYGGSAITPERATRLAALEAVVPVVRAAWRSFDFSWVYITTPDGLMLIYPFVPLAEAVHNDPPNAQVYYTAADFDGRAAGWTSPYLDLVGDGMMVTVSYPVFSGDEVEGVASRDITLAELSGDVLGPLAASGAATALLVDARGLAIGASDPELAAEISQVNSAAHAAVLFYRDAAALAGLGVEGATAASEDWAVAAAEQVIANAGDGAVTLDVGGRPVIGARVEATGWFVILIGNPA